MLCSARSSSHLESGESASSDLENEEATVQVMKRLLKKARNAGKDGRDKPKQLLHVYSKTNIVGGTSTKAAASSKQMKTVKKWTNDEIEMLIGLLEERPCLWDVHNREYHIRDKREQTLSEIGDLIGVSSTNIKAKITTLRAQLGREIGKAKRTS